jgi:hypothetical protein
MFFLFASIKMKATASWQLDDPKVVDGVKTATLSQGVASHSGSDCMVEIAPDPTVEGRQQIHLQFIDPDLAEWCYQADEWALKYLTHHSIRLFKRPLSMTQVKAMYCPITDRQFPRDPCMQAGIDVKTVAYYDQSEVTHAPSDWDFLEVTPLFEIRSMWFADTGTCGLTLDIISVDYDSGC